MEKDFSTGFPYMFCKLNNQRAYKIFSKGLILRFQNAIVYIQASQTNII